MIFFSPRRSRASPAGNTAARRSPLSPQKTCNGPPSAADCRGVTELPSPPAFRVRPDAPPSARDATLDPPSSPPAPLTVLGRSGAFVRCRRLIGRLAPLPMPVLVRGETGTGKEVAARLLHEEGPRAQAPFVAVNCAAIPPGLAESELFGHVRGAFTGAHREHIGAFVRADGGTLFLDEVAELPAALQAKLLRVLELSVVCPVGAENEQIVHARVVAATHRNLEAMVHDGEFREDLLFRLGVLTVELPPLRDRPEDIPLLLEHFAEECSATLGRPVRLSLPAVEAARAHPWPGNVRGLRNAVLRAAVLSDGEIRPEDLLPPDCDALRCPARAVVVPRADYVTMHRALLEQVVQAEGSIRRAAESLGIPRSTLGAWLKRTKAG